MFGNRYFPQRYFADRYYPQGGGAAPPQPAPAPSSGGWPISYEEWKRRRKRDTEDEEVKPLVAEFLGPATPKIEARVQTKPQPAPDLSVRSWEREMRALEAARQRRRRQDDEWFLMN
jgi:hypothetical protein